MIYLIDKYQGLFEKKTINKEELQRRDICEEKNSTCWWTYQMATTLRVGTGESWEPRTSSHSPMFMQRLKYLDYLLLILIPFVELNQECLKSCSDEFQHCRLWLKELCYNIAKETLC